MQLTLTMFVTLDGVVQAPGGPDEDPSGGMTGTFVNVGIDDAIARAKEAAGEDLERTSVAQSGQLTDLRFRVAK